MQRRILINANFYGVGGRETHVVKLCEALVQSGVEVTVVSRVANASSKVIIDALKSIPVRFLATPFAAGTSIKLSTIWAMTFWPLQLRRQSFDDLYTFDISSFTEFLRKFVSPKGRVILNRAGDLMSVADIPGKNIRLPDLMMVESDMQACAVRKLFPAKPEVISVPLLGNYQAPPKRRASKRKGVLEVAFLGRYDENKGAFGLLNIWPNLRDKDLKLSFYGHGDRARLQASIEAQGLSHQVTIKQAWTNAPELAAILEQTDFVVLPSRTEGLPIVLLESIAHGVPFVATDVGAIRTLAEGNADVLVVQNDGDSITAGIDQMASAIRSGVVEGQRLQQFASEKYGYDQLAAIWQQTLLNRDVERVDLRVGNNPAGAAEIVMP